MLLFDDGLSGSLVRDRTCDVPCPEKPCFPNISHSLRHSTAVHAPLASIQAPHVVIIPTNLRSLPQENRYRSDIEVDESPCFCKPRKGSVPAATIRHKTLPCVTNDPKLPIIISIPLPQHNREKPKLTSSQQHNATSSDKGDQTPSSRIPPYPSPSYTCSMPPAQAQLPFLPLVFPCRRI
jgi:hypothetical protein